MISLDNSDSLIRCSGVPPQRRADGHVKDWSRETLEGVFFLGDEQSLTRRGIRQDSFLQKLRRLCCDDEQLEDCKRSYGLIVKEKSRIKARDSSTCGTSKRH